MTPAPNVPIARQLTVADVAWIFQRDERTVRAWCGKVPPEITWYQKFGRMYFDPADVLAAIAGSKVNALRNGDGAVMAADVEKLWPRIERFLTVAAGGREAA